MGDVRGWNRFFWILIVGSMLTGGVLTVGVWKGCGYVIDHYRVVPKGG